MELFGKNPGFCPDCGSILPQLKPNGGVVCYSCARAFSAEGLLIFLSFIPHVIIHKHFSFCSQ